MLLLVFMRLKIGTTDKKYSKSVLSQILSCENENKTNNIKAHKTFSHTLLIYTFTIYYLALK